MSLLLYFFEGQLLTKRRTTVFRREPVWKVSMSVRLRPAVRCALDETQSALRVALREPVEGTQDECVVVYALKVRPPSSSHSPSLTETAADPNVM